MNNFVKLILDINHYRYQDANTVEMCILGCFLVSDVGCYWPSFKEWIFNEPSLYTGGNITNLEKEGDYIIISDQFSEQPDGGPYFKVSKQAFYDLLSDWEKNCKQKPNEVLIMYDGHKFEIKIS